MSSQFGVTPAFIPVTKDGTCGVCRDPTDVHTSKILKSGLMQVKCLFCKKTCSRAEPPAKQDFVA